MRSASVRHRRIAAATALALAGWTALTVADAVHHSAARASTTPYVEEWPVPVPDGGPRLLVPGPDGKMWSTSVGNDYVYRFDTRDGALVSAFHIAGFFHSTNAHLAAGPDGNMWLTAPRPAPNGANATTANAIIRITPSGAQTEYPLSPNGAKVVGPTTIVAGPPSDPNAMWFGENKQGNLVGRLDIATGQVRNYALSDPTTGTAFSGSNFAMTLGPNAAGVPNSAIWLATFSDTSLTDHVIRLTVSPTGAPVVDKVVALPTSWHTFDITGGPVDPVTNRQHDVWLTDDTNDRLGRVDTAGALTTWPVALSDPDPPKGGNQSTELGTGKGVNTPTGITVGPDNKLWVSVKATNSIARFDPDANAGAGGFDQQYRALSGIVRPLDVAVGSDHNIWYASVDDVKIGRVVLDPPAAAPYTPSPTFTLSGRFDYYFPGANYPFHQTGWPMGITSWGGYLDVAMTESDRIQRVPTSLAGGPPDADHEVQDSNVQDPGPATNPWRTLRPGPNTWPRKFASDVGGQHAEWVTMGNDTAYQILPGTASTGEVVTPRVTVTGAAACCLTVAGLIYISGLDGIAAGANGAVLATEFTSSHIVRLDTGAVQEDTLPTPDAGPTDIVAAPDGSYWFTETKVNQIGLRNSNGNYTEFPLPAGDTEPYAITLGPDGAPWFTLRGSGQIGRLDPVTHQVTTYTAPSLSGAAPRATQPTGIHLGPDGQLYVTEFLTGDIVRFDPATSQWTGDWTLPFGDLSRPFWMTTGPDGHIWVTLPYQDQIARLNV